MQKIESNSSSPGNRVFILYPYYWPHFKAGGPTQSLFNLVSHFGKKAQFFVVSSDKDIDGEFSEIPIDREKWIIGPNGEQIFFTATINMFSLLNLIFQVKPSLLFVNGIFNFQTTLPGLIASSLFGYKTVISPRGMLQTWALKRKPLKKKVYLFFIKLLLNQNTSWHATDEKESKDIVRVFEKSRAIFIAPNIPRKMGKYNRLDFSESGAIRLIFLSLINTNKNLHLVIEAVNSSSHFTLDIVGPIADPQYWNYCKALIVNARVRYHGPIPAWTVPAMLNDYHFFVLPTFGENFGHAIFDSLASGLPVLTSRNTPWKDIENKSCGFYIDLNDRHSLVKILGKIAKMKNEEYQLYRLNSYNYAKTYWEQNDYYSQYKFLVG